MTSVARSLEKAFRRHASREFLVFAESNCSGKEHSWDNLRTRMFFEDGSHVTIDSDRMTFAADSERPL